MREAPLYGDVAEGPPGGRAFWLTTADGVRIRAAVWQVAQSRGTVLLLPGRTEYIEKYGRAAVDLAERGYSTVVMDFRGQGLADRALSDRLAGHVLDFAEFQVDIDAVAALMGCLALSGPQYMIAHSMGGCIGLRALNRGLPVRAAVFSSPMWGIPISVWMRPLAQALCTASAWFGLSHRYAPGTGGRTYVLDVPFEGNALTSDPEMWDYMRRQVSAHPDLALGGPSLGWLRAALAECRALSMLGSPDCPVVCALGLAERVVETAPVHFRMARWPGGRLDLYSGAQHEVLMETPAARAQFFDTAAALFRASA